MPTALEVLREAAYFDEGKHPRGGKGSTTGGQFVSKSQGEHSGSRIADVRDRHTVRPPVRLPPPRPGSRTGNRPDPKTSTGDKPTTKPSKKTPLRKGASGDRVMALQQLLTLLGIETAADGQYGNLTEEAVRTAQRKLGMRETGRASKALLRRLADAAKLSPCIGGVKESYDPARVLEATEPHNGAMIALVPAKDHVDRLGESADEDPEQLHATLVFLGKAADIDDATRARIVGDVSETVAALAPVKADGFAVSLFNPHGDEPCVVLGLSGSDLSRAHALATAAVVDVDDLPEQHSPWTPHVTLAYTDDPGDVDLEEYADLTGPLVFDRVRVAFGDDVTDIPLSGTRESVSAWDVLRVAEAFYDVRVPGGNVGGGRFRKLSEMVFTALREWANGEGPAKPLDAFDRDQLRKVAAQAATALRASGDDARAARLTPKIRASHDEIKALLYADTRRVAGTQRRDEDSGGSEDREPPKKAPVKRAPAKKATPKATKATPKPDAKDDEKAAPEKKAKTPAAKKAAPKPAADVLDTAKKAAPAKAVPRKAAKAEFDARDVAAQVSGQQSEAGIITLLSGNPQLTAGKLRKVAEELGIDVPDNVKAKSSLQLHIAEKVAGNRGLPSVAAEREAEVEDAIRQAYARLAPSGGRNSYVQLRELRAELGERYPRAEVDAALVRLNRGNDATVTPETNLAGLSDADKAAAVLIGGQPKHAIAITGRRGTPTPDVTLTPARKVEIEDAVRTAYRRRAVDGWLSMAALREELGDDYPRAEVDQVLREMGRTPNAFIVPESNQKALTSADRDAAVTIGNTPKHALRLTDSTPLRPAGDTPGRAVPEFDYPAGTDQRAVDILRDRLRMSDPASHSHRVAFTQVDSDYQPDAIRDLVRRLPRPAALRVAREADVDNSLRRFTQVQRPDDPDEDPLADLPPVTDAELATVKARAVKYLRDEFVGKPVTVRMRDADVKAMLRDGRIKTAFETGRSGSLGGSDRGYRDMRAEREEMLFGIPRDAPASDRPIYGIVAVDGVRPIGEGGRQAQYGDVQIVLKPNLSRRTTVSEGDSIDEDTLPSPMDAPRVESFNGALHVGTGNGEAAWAPIDWSKSFTYPEAQIHGGVNLADIDEVVFPSPPSPALARQLRDAGVSYRVLGPDTPGGRPKGEAAAGDAPGPTTKQQRASKAVAVSQQRQANIDTAQRLKDEGLSNVAIGAEMGINESSVRALLAPGAKDKATVLTSTSDMLRDQVDKKGLVDVGVGVERHIGISRTKLDAAIAALQQDGYEVHSVRVEQLGTSKLTEVKVLAPPGTTGSQAWRQRGEIEQITDVSGDGGRSYVGFQTPLSISSNRIQIRYADQGGSQADGVIYVRPGVADLSLGRSRYAQVRIAVDGTHYLKGMAVYKDDLPDGVDLQFNTNKTDTGNKLDAMKPMGTDPDNPFGATVRQRVDENGKLTSALNVVGAKEGAGEEGGWNRWSRSLSSQFASKQSPELASRQLDRTRERRQAEFDELLTLTNPTVKAKLLETFADSTDKASVHLKAAALPRQSTRVILPVSSLKDTEVYAPGYTNGEKLVLVRYPHGGIFEIPELVVNNDNPEATKLLGDAPDAIAINHRVAQRLSGADFDGDTVLAIPNNEGRITTAPALEQLADFDPIALYRDADLPPMTDDTKTTEMGKASNLITDMTLKGAPVDEIARAVRHSMVVIDAQKHSLDYRRSEIDHGIPELRLRYQGRAGGRAATLISRARAKLQKLPNRKPRPASKGGPIDKTTGEKVFEDAAGKRDSVQLAEVDDAHTLSSGTEIEGIYADHSNELKALANKARLAATGTKPAGYSPDARKAHAGEVASLDAKLDRALRNAPLERSAQILAGAAVARKREANPGMSRAEVRRLKARELTKARAATGAGKVRIVITEDEWAAIQAGAISPSRLGQILDNADLDVVKRLAMPRVGS